MHKLPFSLFTLPPKLGVNQAVLSESDYPIDGFEGCIFCEWSFWVVRIRRTCGWAGAFDDDDDDDFDLARILFRWNFHTSLSSDTLF